MLSPASSGLIDGEALSRDGSPHPLAEAAPDPILCLDRRWRVTFANRAARRLAQFDPAEFSRVTFWDLFPESHGLPVAKTLCDVMNTGSPDHVEFRHSRSGLWFDVQATPFGDGIAVYFRDISDRRQAETLRQTTAAEVQEFFDATPDSVLGMDPDWTITFCNKAARERATAEPILGSDLWTRFPASIEEPFASNYRRSMHDRVQTEFESFVPAPYHVWLKITARPFGDGIMVLYSDITAMKKAEAVRDASVRELQQVLEASTDAVVSLGRDWTVTFANPQAQRMLGRTDLVGKNVWQEFSAAVESQIFRRYHETMEFRTPCEFEEFYPAPLNMWIAIECRPSVEGIVVFSRDVTPERAAKQVLLDEQARLAFVQERARVATWFVDFATGSMSISEGSFPVYGRPNDQVRSIGDFFSLLHVDDLARMRHGHQRCEHAGDEAPASDFRVIAPDGSIRWVEGRGNTVFDASGAPIGLRGMATEITARKLEEEKLAASEARYRTLADLNPQTLWIGDPDGNISYINQGFLDYRGKTAEDLLGGGWLEGFHPDDQAPIVADWVHSVATGAEYSVQARIRSREGEFRWWALRALPVRDDAGQILNWLGVAHDIHSMKTATETLRRKQEETERHRAEIETVYHGAPIGLALFDPIEFRYLRLNDRQAEIVGMSREQLLGRSPMEIAPIEGMREMFEAVAAGHPVCDLELEGELPSRPGERRFWIVNFHPVYAPDGTVQAIIGSSQEVTQPKKSEAALLQSEKLAAVGRLASSISHEINNPLEAVTNILYLVATDPDLPASAASYVKMAESELARVSQIVTQTLRFHRQAVDRTCVTAAGLVDAVLTLYGGRLSNSGITVETTYSSKTPLWCFENDVRQVLNNLISNAIDAMRTGGRLIVRAHDVSGGPDRPGGVRITLADTGHGMSAATAARIFEPFYTTKDLNGTGLGLWISAGIVDNHKGTLRVRSREDPRRHGTVFTLFLPHRVDRAAPGRSDHHWADLEDPDALRPRPEHLKLLAG